MSKDLLHAPSRVLSESEGADNLPEAVWSGEFTIGGVVLHCHVLDSGQRIIDADDIARLFNDLVLPSEEELREFAAFVKGRGVPNSTTQLGGKGHP